MIQIQKTTRISAPRFVAMLLLPLLILSFCMPALGADTDKKYIRRVEFGPTAAAMQDAAAMDIAAHQNGESLSWIDLLAAVAQQYGGKFDHYRKKDLQTYADAIRDGTFSSKIRNEKLFRYYQEAYGAVLGGMLGNYTEEITDADGHVTFTKKYGWKVFHPLAAGYSFAHSDDFGNSRSYGYRRRHLGHDLFASVGTPVVAIESGYVEALGWNQYGGWRIGIRSFDGKRYYYYAHLRKDHPYADLYEGKIVSAGEIIGYLGMTGYSAKENVNNIQVPHLHAGLELIFDPSQKDGVNQIWIDLYQITKCLSERRVRAYRVGEESVSRIRILDENMPD